MFFKVVNSQPVNFSFLDVWIISSFFENFILFFEIILSVRSCDSLLIKVVLIGDILDNFDLILILMFSNFLIGSRNWFKLFKLLHSEVYFFLLWKYFFFGIWLKSILVWKRLETLLFVRFLKSFLKCCITLFPEILKQITEFVRLLFRKHFILITIVNSFLLFLCSIQ